MHLLDQFRATRIVHTGIEIDISIGNNYEYSYREYHAHLIFREMKPRHVIYPEANSLHA